jgi:hypothetical protein
MLTLLFQSNFAKNEHLRQECEPDFPLADVKIAKGSFHHVVGQAKTPTFRMRLLLRTDSRN